MKSSTGSAGILTPIFQVVSILILAGILLKSSDGAKATEHAYIDHVLCQSNPKYLSNCSCRLNFITRMEKSFTSVCNITQLLDNVVGSTKLYHRFRNGYQLFLIDVNVNLCDYMNKKIGSVIIDLVLPTLRKYVQTNPGQELLCPFIGRFDIIKLPINGALLGNMFVPVGDYMVNLTAATNTRELIWSTQFYFNIPEGKTIEDDRMGR